MLYWIFAGPAIVLAVLSLFGERRRAVWFGKQLAEPGDYAPPATVIVPVKGPDEGLRENLAALASQDYPDYELIVTARQASDIPPGVLPGRVKAVLAHGVEEATAEKIQNLMAGVRAARRRSDILVFADSDVRVSPRWLRALASPLADPGVGASTGFRWFTPEPPTFWTLLRGVWDAVSFGRLGPDGNRFAWGGSMAVRKETFFQARVFEHWRGALSDDFTLAAAMRAAGLRIAFAPGALSPSADRAGARTILAWMRRQMVLTRLYDRRLWLAGLAAHIVYCGGMAASVAASIQGSALAEWALVAQLSPGMLKGLNRATLARAAMPERAAWFRRHAWVHALWTPLATWLWLGALISAAFGSAVEWRGRRYDLRAYRGR